MVLGSLNCAESFWDTLELFRVTATDDTPTLTPTPPAVHVFWGFLTPVTIYQQHSLPLSWLPPPTQIKWWRWCERLQVTWSECTSFSWVLFYVICMADSEDKDVNDCHGWGHLVICGWQSRYPSLELDVINRGCMYVSASNLYFQNSQTCLDSAVLSGDWWQRSCFHIVGFVFIVNVGIRVENS